MKTSNEVNVHKLPSLFVVGLVQSSSGQSEAQQASDEAKICDDPECRQEISDAHAKR